MVLTEVPTPHSAPAPAPQRPPLDAALLRSAATSLGLPAGALGLGFLAQLFLARSLGPASFGLFAFAVAWVKALAVPGSLGIERLIVRESTRAAVAEDWPALRGLLGWAFRLQLAAAAAIALSAAAIAWIAAPQSPWLPFFWIALLIIPLLALLRVGQHALMSLHRPILAQLPESLVLPAVFLSALLLLSLASPLDPAAAIIVQLASTAAAALLSLALLYRALPATVRSARPGGDRPAWTRSLLPMMMVGGAFAISAQVPVLMVGALAGPEAAGLMAVARSLADLAAMPAIAFATLLAPLAGRLWAEGDRAGLQRIMTFFARAASCCALAIVLLLLLLRDALLGLFGAPFLAAGNALVILCAAQAISALAGSNGLLLVMAGRERAVARVALACLLLNLLLCAALIPGFGLAGAASGSTFALMVWNFWLASLVRRQLGLRPSAFASRGL